MIFMIVSLSHSTYSFPMALDYVYISRRTPYPNWFRYREIQCPSTCIHGSFMELDNAVRLTYSFVLFELKNIMIKSS